MQLLRKVWSFGSSIKEMVHLWIVYCRSILEQSCTVWHSSLTQENTDDMERTQKAFLKLLLGKNYINYTQALIKTNLESLHERRKHLNLKWAEQGTKNKTVNDLFPLNIKDHQMETRMKEKYNVTHAKNKRLQNSSVIYMQHLLNEKDRHEKSST